jgi:hypothetical protein
MIIVPANSNGVPFNPIPEGRPTIFNGENQMLYVFEDYIEYSNFLNNPIFNPTDSQIVDQQTFFDSKETA